MDNIFSLPQHCTLSLDEISVIISSIDYTLSHGITDVYQIAHLKILREKLYKKFFDILNNYS